MSKLAILGRFALLATPSPTFAARLERLEAGAVHTAPLATR